MQKTLSVEELWPVKGFDDFDALQDFIDEVADFANNGYGAEDIDVLIDLVYRFESTSLVWLIRSIRSMKNGDAAADDVKKLIRKILGPGSIAKTTEKK